MVTDQINKRDFTGRRVLDVGCRDGRFCFEVEKRGAAYVLGIDNDLSKGAVEFLIPYFKSKVEMQGINVYDFVTEEKFDTILFPGVLYHLRFPFLGFKRLADAMKPGGEIIVETAMYLAHHEEPLLYCPAPKDSPYEPTSVTFYNHLGMVCALESFGFVNVQCASIMTPLGGRFEGYDKFLDSSMVEACDKGIGRAVYTATYSPIQHTVSDQLEAYWYSTHALHADESGTGPSPSPLKYPG